MNLKLLVVVVLSVGLFVGGARNATADAGPIYILVGQSIAAANEEDVWDLADRIEDAINFALEGTDIFSREVIPLIPLSDFWGHLYTEVNCG